MEARDHTSPLEATWALLLACILAQSGPFRIRPCLPGPESRKDILPEA